MNDTTITQDPPRRLGEAGTQLWYAICNEYRLQPHELALLYEACRCADRCALLDDAIGDDLVTKAGGVKRAVVEVRQQQLVLARLLVSLRVPIGDQDTDDKSTSPIPRLPRRASIRGVYG